MITSWRKKKNKPTEVIIKITDDELQHLNNIGIIEYKTPFDYGICVTITVDNDQS